ncbi:hypothetical protein SNE40_022517 [Patella caerulea]|uniref:Prolactin regulatory element-binding protein n=1 Tax=Patella caerulea TaxID=87958 RepID=A0AAN8GFU0_PATCE
MAAAKGCLLANTDFPVYCVRSLGDSHFLIAGGGGQAKTGVPNAIEVYELKLVDDKVIAASICRHDTGLQAVMNCAPFLYDGRNHHLATGQDDECHIYSLKYKVTSLDKSKSEENSAQKRKKDVEEKEKKSDESSTKQIKFDVTEIKKFTTDFGDDAGFQKVVRYNDKKKILATGGADGHLRVWKYPDCTKNVEIKAHKNDIDDLDISPCGKYIVTVSRDHTGCIWSAESGKKITDLILPKVENYRFRSCRYGLSSSKKDKYNIYTIAIPARQSSKPLPCYLTSYSDKYTVRKQSAAGTEILSSLAVSDDGVFIGLGTISGSVAVYISFSLQKLYCLKAAHSIFVTGLEFMPNSENCQALTGGKDFTLLSVSADNTIKLHQVSPRGSISAVWLVLGALLIIYLLFWMLAELGI